jgi:hypothetical protein
MFDDRILKIGVEVNGQLKVYEGASMGAKFIKSTDDKQNTAEVFIDNMLVDTIDYLVTETSPWNPNAKPKLLTISAGRKSTGAQTIFTGDITSSSPSMPPDRRLTMKAKTQENNKYKWQSTSTTKTVQLSVLAQRIADDYGLRLKFEATDKTVANYLYNGPRAKQIAKLNQVGDIDAFIDDDVLVVKDTGKALKGQVRLISKDTGMIGTPTLDEKGGKVRVMFDPNIKLGQGIEIKSDINKAANGQYVIYAMSGSLMSEAQDWYLDLSFNNDNIKSIAEKREAAKKKDAKSEQSKQKT